MENDKTLVCNSCHKTTKVGKFSKSKIPCDCGGVLEAHAKPSGVGPLSLKENKELAKGGFFHASNEVAKPLILPALPLPISTFEKGQKVRVIKHEFIVYGIKCEESGFCGIVEKDLGMNSTHKDHIVRIRNHGNGKSKGSGGMFDILGKYIIIEDW